MSRVSIKRIELTDFKGQHEKEILLNGTNAIVAGKNGSGKTTLADSWYWTMADKDYLLKNNPDIRPDDGRDCVPRVDMELEIDGKPLNIAKYQKKSVSKPKADGTVRVTLSNKYEINGVAKTEKAFREDMAIKGIDFDNFIVLSHIDAFTNQKLADMRSVVFSMASTHPDLEIAQECADCEEVAKLLNDYRLDEIEAMNKAKKKNADERIDSIPNQIKGLEMAKVDIDVAELELQKNAIKERMNQIQKQLDSISDDSQVDALRLKMNEIKALMIEEEEKAQKKVDEEYRRRKEEFNRTTSEKEELERRISNVQMDLRHAESGITRNALELQNARGRYKTLRDSTYDDSEIQKIEAESFGDELSICPTCGQKMLDEQIEQAKEQFESSKKKRLDMARKAKEDWELRKKVQLNSIAAEGNAAKTDLEESQKAKEESESSVSVLEDELAKIAAENKVAEDAMKNFQKTASMDENKMYQEYSKQLESLKEEIQVLPNLADKKAEYNHLLNEKQAELIAVEQEISKSWNNESINDQVSQMKQALRDSAQKSADADKILFQIKRIRMKKNEMLDAEVNSHFSGVKVQLFTYQKNGDAVDACDWFVFDESNQKWTKLIGCANTALAIKGKIAIINGLQNYFGMHLPVFVDYAAELDDSNMKSINADCQIIFLKVTNQDLSVSAV
jgi:DNA repair exonuclease SbcCD ATPase subunit